MALHTASPSTAAPTPTTRHQTRFNDQTRTRLERLIFTAADMRPTPRECLPIRAPFDDTLLGEVPQATPADVEQAAALCRQAQPAWAALPFSRRRAVMVRFHDLLLQRQNALLDIIQLETGKARGHALDEVLDLANNVRHYAYHGQAALKPRPAKTPLPLLTRAQVQRVPLGVVVVIAPWNYPLSMAFSDAIPALLAGNTVLLKPSELTPYTALWTLDLLQQAGLPAEVLQIVTGHGAPISAALVQQADFVNFTGSTATGRKVAAQAGEALCGVSLELGGKNPMIVMGDAPLAAAVQSALDACFSNTGQLCVAIERIYVQRGLFQRFLQRFVEQTRRLTLNARFDYSADVGSLTSAAQLKKTQAHVEDARQQGATVHVGGTSLPHLGPYFYAPTILSGVTPAMHVFHDETFGPVVSVYPFDTEHEAVELANASAYGLNAAVWSGKRRTAEGIASQLRCGTVNINEGYRAAWSTVGGPMGGMGQSGLGRRHGVAGIQKFTEARTVSRQRWLSMQGPAFVPRRVTAAALSGLLWVCRRVPGWR